MSAVSGVKSLPADTKTVRAQFQGSTLPRHLRRVGAPSCLSPPRHYKPGERILIQTILYLENPLWKSAGKGSAKEKRPQMKTQSSANLVVTMLHRRCVNSTPTELNSTLSKCLYWSTLSKVHSTLLQSWSKTLRSWNLTLAVLNSHNISVQCENVTVSVCYFLTQNRVKTILTL